MFRVVDTGLARTPNAPLNGTVVAGAYMFSSHIPKDPATAAVVQGDIGEKHAARWPISSCRWRPLVARCVTSRSSSCF